MYDQPPAVPLSSRHNWDSWLYRPWVRRRSAMTGKLTKFHCRALGPNGTGGGAGTPCSLPRSSTGCPCCSDAASEPSRRISSSVSRGGITGIRAWSADGGHRQDTVLAVVVVCTITHPPERTSSAPSAAHQPRRKPVISRQRLAQPLHLGGDPGVILLVRHGRILHR